MSAQFAIEPVNRMAHISGIGCGFFCMAGNKSLVAGYFESNSKSAPLRFFLSIGNVTHSKASRVLCIKTATFRPGQTHDLPLA